MKALSLLILTALLAGCAGPTVKASSPRSVVIHAGSVQSAQTLANQECAKHNRFAEFERKPQDFVYSFHCVE